MAQDEKKCPFPWFGGKTKAADAVWALIGDVHYWPGSIPSTPDSRAWGGA